MLPFRRPSLSKEIGNAPGWRSQIQAKGTVQQSECPNLQEICLFLQMGTPSKGWVQLGPRKRLEAHMTSSPPAAVDAPIIWRGDQDDQRDRSRQYSRDRFPSGYGQFPQDMARQLCSLHPATDIFAIQALLVHDVTLRSHSEHPGIFTAELRRAFVAYLVSRLGDVGIFHHHQSPRLE